MAPAGSGTLHVVPTAASVPTSSRRPVPGYSGHSCNDTYAHALVGVEGLLRAVAVVRVVIDDQDAFAALRERSRRDGDVVEQAEPHRALGAGVVAGRSHGEEGGVAVAGCERVGGGEPGAGGPYRGRPRPGRHGRVEVDRPAAVLRQRLEALDVRGSCAPA